MRHVDEGMIHAWLDGALPLAEAEGVEKHVSACERCAAAVAEARGLVAASTRILSALDAAPAGVIPGSTAPTVKADTPLSHEADSRRAGGGAQRRWITRRYAARYGAIAAVLAGVVVVSMLARQVRLQRDGSGVAKESAMAEFDSVASESSRAMDLATPSVTTPSVTAPGVTVPNVMAPSMTSGDSRGGERALNLEVARSPSSPPVSSATRRTAEGAGLSGTGKTTAGRSEQGAVAQGLTDSARALATRNAEVESRAAKLLTVDAVSRGGGRDASVSVNDPVVRVVPGLRMVTTSVTGDSAQRTRTTIYEVRDGVRVTMVETGGMEGAASRSDAAQMLMRELSAERKRAAPRRAENQPKPEQRANVSARRPAGSPGGGAVAIPGGGRERQIEWTSANGSVITLSGQLTLTELEDIRRKIEGESR